MQIHMQHLNIIKFKPNPGLGFYSVRILKPVQLVRKLYTPTSSINPSFFRPNKPSSYTMSFRGICSFQVSLSISAYMADFTEDLEPLFDYRRIQPRQLICLDDDEVDTLPGPPGKITKTSNSVEHANIIELDDCEDKDEEDWLPPPPKVSKYDEEMLMEDSTIKELRIKKKELESLAKSAENVIRAVEESVIREIGECKLDNQTSKLPGGRAKIIISIQDKDGMKQFRIFMDEKFERLFKMYSDKHKIDQQKLVFSFDGERLSPGDTAIGLGMEDNDIIEVHVKSS